MQASIRLLARRRFLPLFATLSLGAFNDNLFKTAMVMLVTFHIFSDPAREAQFNAVAGALFILPFFLLSAVAGQLADARDKAGIIRFIKSAEILIMIVGSTGLWLHNIPLMLLALFAMGAHSAFFGPIKYAILPQHLGRDEVLGGTGLVEAGTYIAILSGTIAGGVIPSHVSAGLVLAVALLGRLAGQQVPPAHPEMPADLSLRQGKLDFHVVRSSIRLVSRTMHIPRLFLAIASISFFWAQGAILAAQFPPLVKNVLGADQHVATMFLAIFSVGVAVGSIVINRMLGGAVSARYSPVAALVMGLFICDIYWVTHAWPAPGAELLGLTEFVVMANAERVMIDLFGVAVAGGIFVVPLFAFLTTTVSKAETARTVAANNIVNSGAMVFAALLLFGMMSLRISVAETLLIVALASPGAAFLSWRLHRACERD